MVNLIETVWKDNGFQRNGKNWFMVSTNSVKFPNIGKYALLSLSILMNTSKFFNVPEH